MKQCAGCGERKPLTEFHRMKANADGYRPRCKVCRRAETTEYYVANSGAVKARSKAWREANPERYRQQLVSWGERNREHKREINQAWRDANRGRIKAVTTAYQRLHPEHARNQKARRKAQMGATVHRITKTEWEDLKAEYHGGCAYCSKKVVKPTMDHIVPLIRGGGHTVDNIVPACSPCNREKGMRSVVEFLTRRSQNPKE